MEIAQKYQGIESKYTMNSYIFPKQFKSPLKLRKNLNIINILRQQGQQTKSVIET